MEASGQRTKPSWMPAGLDPDALREQLRGLKDRRPGGSGTGAPGAYGSGGAAGATMQTPPFEERPEFYVGAAFAGGLALAGFLRLLGR
jgi:hypothetical protein